MLTFFTTAKPFRSHEGIIQKNALKSWTLLHPDVEVILFGDDGGAAAAAEELRLRHEPRVERNEFGTKRLDFMFWRATGHRTARTALLHQLRHRADAGFSRRDQASTREALAFPHGGTTLGHGNHRAAEF